MLYRTVLESPIRSIEPSSILAGAAPAEYSWYWFWVIKKTSDSPSIDEAVILITVPESASKGPRRVAKLPGSKWVMPLNKVNGSSWARAALIETPAVDPPRAP